MPYVNDSPEKDRANYKHIRNGIQTSENNINFGLLDVDEYPLPLTERCNNQILVVYRNGRFESLPSGMSGHKIKDYLGIRFYRIKFWTVVPAVASNLNPATRVMRNKGCMKITSHNGRDIYECE